ncbi:AAA family ATPase [Noviherbaspirillum massiliense]|uniref:AAA family ATPase n=1 Tax=Noviherbaspirillum massiliense TaxID=1465823 RepID=UPI0003096A4E|nr:AAA family ATPase [Noviherbaspirillum massiliense]
MELILFIGIQASGKTSFYLERFFQTHVRISMDLLRTRHREQAFMETCLQTQQRFVVDNTNPTRAERLPYIERARQAKFRVIGYFFEPNPQASFERNQKRDTKHRVPPAGLFGTLKRLERPTMDEGFNALYQVRAEHGKFEILPLQEPDAARLGSDA